jgi:hypothetical protein
MKVINSFVIMLALCLALGNVYGQVHSGPNCINLYVNSITGNDAWDGLSPTYVGGTWGPKATLQSGVNAASWNDIVNVAAEYYNESVTIDKNLTLVGPSLPSIMHLTLLNNSIVQFANNFHILGTLTLLSGELRTSTNRITVANSDPSAVVITGGCVSGEIERAIAGGSAGMYKFTNAHTCIIPDGTQPSMWLSVRVHPNQQPPNITGGTPVNRYYDVMASQPLNGALRIAYLPPELNGIPEANLTSFRHTGASWANEGGVVNVSSRCVDLSTVSFPTYSSWTLGDATHPLPIQLASFNALVTNRNDVRLNWQTLTETNNYGFYVQQRSSSSIDFFDVPNSFVQGHGTTVEPHDYNWIHHGVLPGTYYYRLKQVDLDGTIHFSEGRQVEVLSPTGATETYTPSAFNLAQNYPNPFNPSTQIQFTVEASGYTTLSVFDILGKEVKSLYADIAEPGKLYSVSFDASGITNGTYFYKLVNGNKTSIKNMLLLK